MAYERFTVREYRDALYSNDRTVMNQDELDTVYSEFVETTGLYLTEEFEKVTYIYWLTNRINSVKIGIRLQRGFLQDFGVPLQEEGFKIFKKYGYFLTWKNNKEDFEQQLKSVEIKETRYTTTLDKSIKELELLREKRKQQVKTPEKENRGNFIRTFISLGKIGYKLDMDKTMVEEYAYMIKQQLEENENIKSR